MRSLVISILLSITVLLCGCSHSGKSDTVENLLTSVGGITNGQTSFELFVPGNLTLQGKPVPQDVAMAIVVDKLLGHGLFPNGLEERAGGRLYRFKKQ